MREDPLSFFGGGGGEVREGEGGGGLRSLLSLCLSLEGDVGALGLILSLSSLVFFLGGEEPLSLEGLGDLLLDLFFFLFLSSLEDAEESEPELELDEDEDEDEEPDLELSVLELLNCVHSL